MVKISIAVMLRNVGSTVSFIGSGRRSFMAATNGSYHVGLLQSTVEGRLELVKCGSNVAI